MTAAEQQPASSASAPRWSSRYAFLMASIGAAVGLGNLWRFPFQTGQNGGSAFVLVYILCVVLIAYPIMMGEIAVGRRKRLSAVGSTAGLAADLGRTKAWGAVGFLGLLATYLVMTIYCVIAGQVIAYAAMAFLGNFSGAGGALSLYDSPAMSILWQSLFLGVTMIIVAIGLRGGVERVGNILMPAFFALLAALSAYALATGAAAEAVDYLFAPRFDEITPAVVLAALGQAFFSLSVGGGAMLTFGAFLDKNEAIGSNAAIIAGADTLVAIIAGLMIFPVVFAHGLDPAAGMSLIFNTLPRVFSTMPFGDAIGGLFFVLAFIAALTTSVAMLLITVVFTDEYLRLKRHHSILLFGFIAWAIGAASVLAPAISGAIDFFAGNVLMPTAALLGSIFVGWIVPRDIMREELHGTGEIMFRFWRFLMRFAAPLAVAAILALGIDAKFGFGLNAFIASLGAK